MSKRIFQSGEDMQATITKCENGFLIACGEKTWIVTNLSNATKVLRMIYEGGELEKDNKGRLRLK